MNTLKDLIRKTSKTALVHVTDAQRAEEFLRDAENCGIVFSDGARPTEKETSDFFAVHPDMTMNYVGTNGRIAFQCRSENYICVEWDSES